MPQFVKRIVSSLQKAFTVFAVFIAIISIFAHFINRDKPQITNSLVEKNRKDIYSFINDPKYKNDKMGNLLTSVFRINTCIVLGEACTNNPLDASKNFSNSLIGKATGLMTIPIANPPASGISWTANTLANAGLIPKIYAAGGIGFGSLNPVMMIWNTMRNISYLLLVLVIVSIGFMVMFRSKINPQTVISVENALPKIVMALIYITFSFAIAGFLIDIMYALIAIIISLIGSTPGTGINVPVLQKTYLSAGPGEIFNILYGNKGDSGVFGNWAYVLKILWTLPNALLNIVPIIGIFARLIGTLVGVLLIWPWMFTSPIIEAAKKGPGIDPSVSVGLGVTVRGLIEMLTSGGLAGITLVIALILGPILFGFIIGLVIWLTVLMLFFQILFLIFSSYIKLLMFIALAPLILMLEAIPGQSTFTTWLRTIISELSIYPVLVTVSLIAILIAEGAQSGVLLQPPFLTNIDSQSYATIISMWFLFMIPEFVGIVQKAINPKPLPLNAGLGTFFGGASSGISAGLGEMSKYAVLAGSFRPLGAVMNLIPGFGPKKDGK